MDDARDLMPPLQEAWQRGGDPVAGQAVAQWLARSGESAAAIEIARTVLRGHSARVLGWRVLVDTCAPEHRLELAAELAAAAETQSSPWRRAELTLERAVVLAATDPEVAVTAFAEARASGIGPDETVAAMRRAVAQGADG